jgi:glycosyltransferase involved in cell wall biosynthesis
MRIWLLTHLFLPEFYAGTETITLQTAVELRRQGHTVTVLAGHPDLVTARDAVKVERYEVDDVPVIRFRSTTTTASGAESGAPGGAGGAKEVGYSKDANPMHRNEPVAAALAELLKTEPQPDIVHVFHLAYIGLNVLPVLKSKSIPVILTATDFWPICPLSIMRNHDGTPCAGPREDHGNCMRHFVQYSLPQDQIASLSEYSDEDFGNLTWLAGETLTEEITEYLNPGYAQQEWFRNLSQDLTTRRVSFAEAFNHIDRILVPSNVALKVFSDDFANRDKLELLPFGIEKTRINRQLRKRGSGSLRLTFIGQITEHKGLEILIKAVKLLSDSVDITLAVYGDFLQDQYYAAKINELAAGDSRIEFKGIFKPFELGMKLAEYDAIVIPSLWSENTPMVLLASQSAGCPAIVSDEEGLCEIVKDGINGLTFETGNASELAQRISTLVRDRTLLEKLSANTVDVSSITDHVSSLVQIYKSAMGAPSTRH